MADRFLIGKFTEGERTDVKPWQLQEDAFATLANAFVFRERVEKRFGTRLMGLPTSAATWQLLSRLRINIGTTDGSGNFAGVVPGHIFAIGQMFSIGSEIFTVVVLGNPGVMLDTGASVVHTYDTTTGAVVITGAAPLTVVYFYPATPVMGITIYDMISAPTDNEPTYAFDTQFAYTFIGTWVRSGTVVWHGNDTNFFWAENWTGLVAPNQVLLFVSNFNATIGMPAGTDDPMYYFNGATWTAFTPYFMPAGGAPNTGPRVFTALLIIAFKNRLLLLNTIEQNAAGNLNTQYAQRVRYSHNGSPLTNNAYYEPNQMDNAASTTSIADGGGYIDATTDEEIVSAEFIKDRLIVFFERSTWELAYTGNEILPFVWQKINTELGSESTFSSIPFDKAILTMSNTGIHACNGANVERIDQKIPDIVFEINTLNNGLERVAGIRDYYKECAYWAFPSTELNSLEKFPNRIFVYNYRNNTWAFNVDTFTAFGYFEQQASGMMWQNAYTIWEKEFSQWNSGQYQQLFKRILAGTPEGFVLIIDNDEQRNAPSMQITNMTSNANGTATLVIINHTLAVNDFIYIENAAGIVLTEGLGIYEVVQVIDANTIVLGDCQFTGTYLGGGTAARVSSIQILSKRWNPYVGQARNVYLSKIDFGVARTSKGKIEVDYYPSSTELSMIQGGVDTGAIVGTNILEMFPYDPLYAPLEQEADYLWHSIYFQTVGEFIQIAIQYNFDQITDPMTAFAPFEMQGMVLYTNPSGRLQ